MLPKWRFKPAVHEVDAFNPEIALAPWAGHRQFAYDYIVNIRPHVVVELGTFHGCAFFSFCQAAKDEGLDWTTLHAVDTWLGTKHDTFYGEEVFETFRNLCSRCYGGLPTRLVRKLFNEAVSDFADGSIDLLHIDGTHTYGAVEEDYANWLPKMAPEGVVFLHDVFTERHGTTRFWRELTLTHPSLLFEHCFGLGLLFPKGDKLYRHLVDLGLPGLAPFYRRIGELEMAVVQERAAGLARTEADVNRLLAEKDEEQARQRQAMEDAVREARAEAAASKQQAEAWWQAAQDAQWKLDQLEGKGL